MLGFFADMVRNLLVLLMFLGVGFGTSVAQSDIFVRHSPKEQAAEGEVQKKKSIFLRPFSKTKNTAEKAQNQFRSRLNTDGLRQQVVKDLNVLAYWKERDLKPQNVVEMASYAVALGAENRALMLKNREAAIPALMAKRQTRIDNFQARMTSLAPNQDGIRAFDALILAEAERRVPEVKTVRAVYQGVKSVKTIVDNSQQQPSALERKPVVKTRVSVPKIYRRVPDSNGAASDGSSRSSNGVYTRY